MTDYDQQRRDVLLSCPPADPTFRSTVEDAPLEELNEAFDARARKGQKSAWKIIRTELRRRNAEGGCPIQIPATIEAHRATFVAADEQCAADHYTYEHATPMGKAILIRKGYKPRAAAAPLSMSKPKSNSTKTKGTVIVLDQPLGFAKPALKKFQIATLAAIEEIALTDRRNTSLRVKVGFALGAVKESLAHGEFTPWLKANVKAMGYTECTYMMRLARVLAEATEFSADDLRALANGKNSLALAPKKSVAAKLDAAVKDFVGELSWGELLAKYKITDAKKIGGARESDKPAAPVTVDAEQLAAQTKTELAAWLETGRQLLVQENVCTRLAADDIRQFAGSLKALDTEFRTALPTLLKAE